MNKLSLLTLILLLIAGSLIAQKKTDDLDSNDLSSKNKSKKYRVGERVDILSPKEKKWYPGLVKEIKDNGYLVSYDGYASNYDKVVMADRLRPGNTEIPGVKHYIALTKGKTKILRGNVKEGKVLANLNFAQSSSVACFPGTRFVEFQGKQVFYWLDLPPRSILKITVTPKDGKRINLYAYSGFDGKTLPPNIVRCVSCEAAYEIWSGNNPPKDFTKAAGPQSIQLNAANKPYRVLLAVSGAKGVIEGDFELSLSLQ